jgi:UDP-N-acetylmuramoyl-tripeptide--D-alanyl-D-alanine ligase
MLSHSPEKLAIWSGGYWKNRELLKEPLTGFCIDTRKVRKGDVFVAITTENRDGHSFLHNAKVNGARAAFVDRYISDLDIPQLVVGNTVDALMLTAHGHRMEFPGTVIGITGSCGKTSTKDVLTTLLGESVTCKTQANLNNQLGLSLTLLTMDPDLHKYAVVEAGISEMGEMEGLARTLTPDIGILTIVGSAHAEGIGGIEQIAHEKCKLLRSVRNNGVSLFPEQCLQFEAFSTPLDNPLILTCEEDKSFSKNKLAFSWEILPNAPHKGQLTVRNELLGKHSFDLPDPAIGQGAVRNIAMSLGVSLHLGIRPEQLQERILRWKPSPLRGEIRSFGKQVYFVDCYNANPVSMQEAISTFENRFQNLPKLYVLGSMNELGEDSWNQHVNTGRTISLGSEDRAVLIGKEANAYQEGMVKAGNDFTSISIVDNVDQSVSLIQEFEGAILLKGSRSYGLERLLQIAESLNDEMSEEGRLVAEC